VPESAASGLGHCNLLLILRMPSAHSRAIHDLKAPSSAAKGSGPHSAFTAAARCWIAGYCRVIGMPKGWLCDRGESGSERRRSLRDTLSMNSLVVYVCACVCFLKQIPKTVLAPIRGLNDQLVPPHHTGCTNSTSIRQYMRYLEIRAVPF
jgi:hypothetical protein